MKGSGSIITITFGDQAENHVGMQKIGKLVKEGMSIDKLREIATSFKSTELIDLSLGASEPAAILIIRNGLSQLLAKSTLQKDLLALDWDSKAKMYGRFVNKKARHNLCFSTFDQEPDYEAGKGRVVDFKHLPQLTLIKDKLSKLIDAELQAEGNLYYDVKKWYIGFHGDTEQRIVIGLRLDGPMPLFYQWYRMSKPVGKKKISIKLNDGDMYFMSAKAVGSDWKKRSALTLRHAAGFKVA